MKILKAYFKNFQGFYTGMNLVELKLDFTKGINSAFNVIFGKNASGKSTLLSILQPFPGTNDNRSDIIRAGHEGRKDIIFQDTPDKIYRITIIYPVEVKGKRPTEKCYIYKLNEGASIDDKNGWTNLNPNGGKQTYITALEDYLHITKDFFMVGRLGGVDNFIDLNKSDRKKFIANFLPDVDPYLTANEIVSKKVTTQKKMMVTFGEELNKLAPQAECEANLSRINTQLTDLNEELEKQNQIFGSSKGFVDNILESTTETLPELRDFARTGVNPLIDEIKSLEEKIQKLKDNLRSFTSKEELEADIEKINAEIIKLSEAKAKKESNKATAIQNQANFKLEMDKLSARLSAVQSKIGLLESLNAQLDQRLEEEKGYLAEKEEFKKPIFKHFANMTPEVMITFKGLVTELRIMLNEVRNAYDEAGLRSLSLTDSKSINKEMFEMTAACKKATATIERIAESKAKLPLLEANAKSESILLKRPTECKIDKCPFISAALEFEGATLEYKRVLKIIETSSEEEEKAKIILEDYQPKIKFLSSYEKSYAKIAEHFKSQPLLKLYPKIQDITLSIDKYLEAITISSIEFDELMNIDHIESYVNHKANLAKVREDISTLRTRISEIEESSTFVKQLNQDHETAERNYNEATSVLETVDSEVEDLETDIQNKKNEILSIKCTIQSVDLLKERESELSVLKIKSDSMEKYLADVSKNRDIMLECKDRISKIKGEIETLSSDKDKFTHQIESRKDLEDKLLKMQDEFKTLEIVKRCTDTVKGIPLYLIDAYLEDIRQRTNTLLQVAYNGDFILDRFVINEKEFAIPVIRSNGDKLEDITLGSGAETSLVKSSLSFAIIQKAMGGYNILSLDEIDGCLDEAKRKEFISMLRKQVEELGIEQMFIISHNRVFLDESLNLILLKDHGIETDNSELMSNKAVIYDYYK